jgi:hypothetical protein
MEEATAFSNELRSASVFLNKPPGVIVFSNKPRARARGLVPLQATRLAPGAL